MQCILITFIPILLVPLWEFSPISQEGRAVFRIPTVLYLSDLASSPQLCFCFKWITEYNLCYPYTTTGYRVLHRNMDDLPETILIKKDVSLSTRSHQLTEVPQGWGGESLWSAIPSIARFFTGLILGRPCTDNCIYWATPFLMPLF